MMELQCTLTWDDLWDYTRANHDAHKVMEDIDWKNRQKEAETLIMQRFDGCLPDLWEVEDYIETYLPDEMKLYEEE